MGICESGFENGGAEMLQEIQLTDMDVNFRKLVGTSALGHEILIKSGSEPIARIIPFCQKKKQKVKVADENRGQKMAAILDQLSKTKAFSEVTDPAAWQKEIRRDRSLPERDDAD